MNEKQKEKHHNINQDIRLLGLRSADLGKKRLINFPSCQPVISINRLRPFHLSSIRLVIFLPRSHYYYM